MLGHTCLCLLLTALCSQVLKALARLVGALYIPFPDLCCTWVLSPRFVHLTPVPLCSVLCQLTVYICPLSVNTAPLVTFLRGRRRLGCRRDLACRSDFKAPTAACFLSPLCTHGTETNERYAERASVWRHCGKCFRWSCQVRLKCLLPDNHARWSVIDGAPLMEHRSRRH